ncbi:arginine repressor [Vibrio sp. UCD-FRSSP16_10]|uniref:arginine repressor n=1 Tax=unclassified Vibrio TaxID=2614977 RepID=UPI0008023454|nr:MULTISPECIES: arginine repressor [unclassified Vibrio]OBT16343.1 arginine repressor [Vibrio sp. UCD-FRSSP16_30]OBT21208.1 arginine repressor [Vibrio sp. UCD-FRSSP16_10]
MDAITLNRIHNKEKTLESVCKQLLQTKSFYNQSELRRSLIEHGFSGISQSTVSRLLCQLGVIKVANSVGKKVYYLTPESSPIRFNSSIASQIDTVEHNKAVIMVKTKPGSAQLIARLIDFDADPSILGSIAGDDTVLVIPKDVEQIERSKATVLSILDFH